MSDKSLREKIDWLVKQVKCLGSQGGGSALDNKLDKGTYTGNAQDLKNDIVNLEGINYIWSPINRTLTLYDKKGTQLSQVSLVSLDNEGTDLRYNASTLSLELWNAGNELLDSIPVSSFIGSVGTQLQLNSNQLQLRDSKGNVLSTVGFTVSNIQGLQTVLDGKEQKISTGTTSQYFRGDKTWQNLDKNSVGLSNVDNTSDANKPISNATQAALGSKLDKGTYTGTASDLKSLIDTKISGSGTVNYIPKFSASGTVGNSIVYDNGTNVGIGTTSPSEKLDVNGKVKATSFIKSGGTSSQFLMADGTVNSNTYAKTDGTNATDNWSNTSSGLALNPSVTGKTLNASGQTVTLRDATYGQVSGIVQDNTGSPLAGQWTNRLKTLHNNSTGFFTELAQSFAGTEGVWHRRNVNGTISSWKQLYDDSIWNAASLSYSGSTLTLKINGISKTATINAQRTITITGNTTLSETHNGAVLNVTNTCNITIPTGLDSNFQCVIFAKGSIVVTFVNSGVTIYAPSGLLLKKDKMASLISTSANNFNLTGELATS